MWNEQRTRIQENWLWLDEIDHVNVIVYSKTEKRFIFLRQRKYGLESTSYATVGGFIEVAKGETGFEACRREVKEEIGYTSAAELDSVRRHLPYDPKSDSDWIPLGRYRTASNRGGGFLTSYLLKAAVPIPVEYLSEMGFAGLGTGDGVSGDEGGHADGEKQTVVKMTPAEARSTLLQGGFQEVKWTASLALALLHFDA